MEPRRLGKSGIQVSPMGFGCWAIGGPIKRRRLDGTLSPMGWGDVNDDESIKAIHTAIDMGVTLFDTASNYGAGHSEVVLGQALEGKRDKVIIATKFGSVFDEDAGEHIDVDDDDVPVDEAFIRDSLEGSLRRLRTDYIDLYQFHRGAYPVDRAEGIIEVLEKLVQEGKIRYYGWSTDHPERARVFGEGVHGTSVQARLNIFADADEMIVMCDELDLAFLNKSPLNSGILSGKYSTASSFPANDLRHGLDLTDERIARLLDTVQKVGEVLTSNGRTMVQGALAWIWARSDRTLPIPGFKGIAQATENAKAMDFGPLSPNQMEQIDQILQEYRQTA